MSAATSATPTLPPVFNALPGANLLLAPDLSIVAASDDYLVATLTQRTAIVGEFIFDAFPDNPETPEANGVANVRASLLQVLATKQPHEMAPQHYDVPDRAQPGQFVERHWLPRHTPVLDAAGQVQFIIQSVQDVTASRLAERQLSESRVAEQAALAEADAQRQRLHNFMSAAPGIVLSLVGPQHIIEFANEGFRKQFGVLDPIGKPYLEALPGAADQYAQEYEATALYDHIYRTGEPYYADEAPYYVNFTHSGQRELRYFTFSMQAARDGAGNIIGVQAYAFDVTEQVRARQQVEQLNQELEVRVQERTQQVRTQSQRLERLFTQAPAAICILAGPDLVFELVNPIYQKFFRERQLVGKPLREALPELADHAAYYTMRQVFDTGETNWQQALHVPMARTVGEELEDRYFNYIQQPRYDEQGRIDGVLVFGFEVTEMVQARQQVQELNEELAVMNQELAVINEEMQATNEELNQSNDQLTRTNVDLDNFIYTASHDLKAPISNIEGLLHALQEQLPPNAQQAEPTGPILQMMQSAIDRFKQTIDHLTDISKLQQEHAHFTEQVNLAAVVENVRLDLLPLLEETGAQLKVAVTDCTVIAFSEKNLRSVVYNLLSNALKYRHPNRAPQIQVTCEQADGALLLRVADNGLGLDKVQQAKLFGMFQRLHTHVEGSGIGLYMVKKMVENVGGKIEVKSSLGEGSVFTVSFPA